MHLTASQIRAGRPAKLFPIGKSCMLAYSSEKLKLTHERRIKPVLDLSRGLSDWGEI